MRKIHLIPAAWITIGVLFFIWYSCNNPGGTEIRMGESGVAYEFYARYDKDRTDAIARYIDHRLQPHPVFEEGRRVNSEVVMEDSIHFSLHASAGKISIKASKQANSPGAQERLKQLFHDIRHIIDTGQQP